MEEIRVYISYSPGMSVTYCFWKYFFHACGIWVTEEKITDVWKLDVSKSPQLLIFDNGDDEKIVEKRYNNIVYCVKKSFKKTTLRDDIIKIKWWDGSFYKDVINKLLFDFKDREVIGTLLGIFNGTDDIWKPENGQAAWKSEGLWGVCWLFHEIAGSCDGRWDEEIIERCSKAVTALDDKKFKMGDNWYYQFMRLYCRYILCGVQDKDLEKRGDECKILLEKCEKLAKSIDWYPSLYMLAGKICCLSATENKYAIGYFKSAALYENKASIFYDIGHIYEKAYGDYERALRYYRKAYSYDSEYYPALYKMAADMEEEGRWVLAVGAYGEVRRIIKNTKYTDSISVRDLEYNYKACRRIMLLFKKNTNDKDLISQYQQEITNMFKNVNNYVDYTKLMGIMFVNAKKKEGEILEELRKKLNTECCNK